MIVTDIEIPDLLGALCDGSLQVRGSDPEPLNLSLPAVVRLALLHADLTPIQRKSVAALNIPGLPRALRALEMKEASNPGSEFRGATFGFWSIKRQADLLHKHWYLFTDRFRIAAANGSRAESYRAFEGVLREMADNIASHAYDPGAEFTSLIGYHVEDGTACFTVADKGMGFLNSLRNNPKWKYLENERAAIEAVIYKQATARTDENTGGGFRNLFDSLLDRNGQVLIRSNGESVTLVNQAKHRELSGYEDHAGSGAQVSVIMRKAGTPTELPLKTLD